MDILTIDHPRFSEFLDRLKGVDGINFHRENGHTIWECVGNFDHVLEVLSQFFPEIDEIKTVEYLSLFGNCDCDILFNIDDVQQ